MVNEFPIVNNNDSMYGSGIGLDNDTDTMNRSKQKPEEEVVQAP